MINLQIIRQLDDNNQTLGYGFIYDDLIKIFEFRTLELPDRNNLPRISCIPVGFYNVIKFDSPTFGNVFLLEGVPDRSMIEIHAGNYNKDTLGCILPGDGFADINRDGLMDVTSSRKTMNTLYDLLPEEFKINIYGPPVLT